MTNGNAFDSLKARYCLAAIVIAWYWQPGSLKLAQWLSDTHWYPQWYGWDLVFHYYADAGLMLFLAGLVLISRPRDRLAYVLGRAPVRQDIQPIAITVVLTFLASGAIVTLTFLPLSYLFPGFVDWWLRWTYGPIVYVSMDGTLPIGANLLGLVSLVVVSPGLQELIFRGYLLHRWSNKWGLWYGVVLSSAVFGAVHPDTLSAMVTGVGFALLYLRTQSLWTPIIAHGIYNLVVWLWNLAEVISNRFEYVPYTIDDLRGDWWLGAIELIVALLIVDRILRRKEILGPFKLPTPAARMT
jgi:membrane protease YdiL (CAAX protease family)